ncbi:efflux RND transporter periplasmic adaptor subunit [Agrobacterium genomosp. 13]|nr:efflux RND transporter periplasmic adaptor subunit [Agrobacterium genomosp. 13]
MNILFVSSSAIAQGDEAATLTVTLTRPVQRQWPETVPASGWLKPWHEAIIAAEANGLRVTEVLADVGSVVSRGQPLVKLTDETVRTELRKEEAALASAQAALAKAKSNADRARKVGESGAISEEKATDYLIAEQTAVAGVASAEAALDSQRIKLAQTTIRAVDDGVVTSRSVQLGSVVSPGTELFRIIRQRKIEWQSEVSARYLNRIKEGLPARIAQPGGQLVKGVVRLVSPTISTDTGRALVYVELPRDAQNTSGLYVTGWIELETITALTLPETALVMRDGIAYVFTVDTDGRTSRIRVETGRRNDGEVEIVSGLKNTAKVVSSGGAFLSDRAVVRVEGEVR